MEWNSKDLTVLLNPRMKDSWKKRVQSSLGQLGLEELFWVSSSGTEASIKGTKLVGLKKEGFLTHAELIVSFLSVSKKDIWLNPLPKFHVGGLSIEARCFVSGAREVVLPEWSLRNFVKSLDASKPTALSLVPTQIFDLVRAKIKAPDSLRFVLVGGGALDEKLYFEARNLGWPLLPSYGMTETSAMVAGSPLSSISGREYPAMEVVPGVKLEKHGKKWSIDCPGLFECWVWVGPSDYQVMDRPVPFLVDDVLELKGNKIKVLGRETELVKILGESVNLRQLENQVSDELGRRVAVVALPDERKGFELVLVSDQELTDSQFQNINGNRLPFERLKRVFKVKGLPLTDLGKLKRQTLKNEILSSLS